IPGRKDPKANIHKLVYDWLRDEKNGKWLLIFDNVDDPYFLSKPGSVSQGAQWTGLDGEGWQPLSAYIPHNQNGWVLITARNTSIALKMVEKRDMIAVEPMAKSHALALFEKKLGMQNDSDEIAELIAALEFMPLAIVQAASYISQRAPRCSVRQYLEDFQKSDRKKTSLLNYEGVHLQRDLEAKNSIIITWQISFEHIRQTRPSAADLLSLMSFFDRQGIPEALVLKQTEGGNGGGSPEVSDESNEEENGDSASESSEENEFEDDVQILRDYAFISIDTDGTFEMHALVQLAMRTWLEANRQLEKWKHQYITNLSYAFPTGKYENWTRCQALFPHAKSAVTQRPKADGSLEKWALLLYNAAWYAWKKWNINEAVSLSKIAMNVWEKMYGKEHIDTLNSMEMLGLSYKSGGQWEKAEKLQVRVVEISKRVLGEEHLNTLKSISKLASIYSNQGRWTEAEELEVRLIETRKRVLGEEHVDTLTCMGILASIYLNHGRWTEAEDLEVRVMETMKKVLGEEHPNTLDSIANLALIYWNQKRWTEAEELGVRVIETRKRVLGEEHPDTLTSISNLALTSWSQRRWTEAEKLNVRVIEISKRLLGEEHPDTLTSINNLAVIYQDQERWTEAEELELRVIETRKRVLGEEHPDTLISINNLALIYQDQERWTEAEELELRVTETRKRVLGEEHPYTLTSMANLAFTWKAQGRDAEAIQLMKECVHLRTRILGVSHPHTLKSTAVITDWQGCKPEAESFALDYNDQGNPI
ncbi:MAG: hypothetical protein Q9164_007057, partial [Protoblastenia rupestris]